MKKYNRQNVYTLYIRSDRRSMTGKIQRWGNSLAIRIPKVLADQVLLSEGSAVQFSIENGEIHLIPQSPKGYQLEELVGMITPENQHGEADFGMSEGQEWI